MSNVNLNINVTQTGARTVRRQLQGIVDTANNATRVLRLFQNALFVLGAAGLVSSIQRTLDLLTNFENRIRLVTDTTDELNNVQKQLFDISERTRSSFQGTAEVYTRVALSVRELGISQQEVLNFTESLNQAVILSGAAAREANAALIQLGQGLASNRLSGDELRSVLEQLPFVADIIAKELGITRGELRQFGKEGKLTAEIVLQAFRNARAEIAGKFAETVSTIAQAFQRFNAVLLRNVDAFDDTFGVSEAVANSIIFLSDNLDAILRVLAAATLSITAFGVAAYAAGVNVLYLNSATALLTRGLVLLTAAALANPFTALAAVLVIVTSLIVTFSDQILVTDDGVTTLADSGVAAFQLLNEAMDPVVRVLREELGPAIDIAIGAWDKFSEISDRAFQNVLAGLRRFVNILITTFIATVDTVVKTWDILPKALGDVITVAFNSVLTIVEKAVNGILDAIRKLFAAIDRLAQSVNIGAIFGDALNDFTVNLDQFKGKVNGAAVDVGKTFVEEFKKSVDRDFIGEGIDAILKRAQQRAIGRTFETLIEGGGGRKAGAGGAGGEDFQKIVDRLRDENELLRLNFEQRDRLKVVLDAERRLKRDLSDTERDLLLKLADENILLKDQNNILEAVKGPANEYERTMRALVLLLADGQITIEQFNKQVRDTRQAFLETQTDAVSGIERGINGVLQDTEDFASQFEGLVTNAFSGIENAFVEFAKTGKLNFQDLANSIISDLARIVARAIIIRPLLQALGVSGGGAGLNIPGFQNGGSIIVGGSGGPDSQLVVARASPGERIDFTPANDNRSSGGNVVVNVINNSSAQVSQSRRRGSDGSNIVDIVLNEVDRGLASGRFDGSLRGRFGIPVRQTGR